jgi:RNA-directed DNA polymerase
MGVADPRILRLIQKWLNAGVMEEGKWSETETGTPQGSVISPMLANIYLHYVFDLWVDVWRAKCAQGDVVVVRYADDTILGFQHQVEADRFLENFRERLGKFKSLFLHPDLKIYREVHYVPLPLSRPPANLPRCATRSCSRQADLD